MSTSARSPILLTVTVMEPEGSADLGVTTTCVVEIVVDRVTGILLPLPSVTTMLLVVTVLASGASLKVMVMAVVGLTQSSSGNGLTFCTVMGELSVSARVVKEYE